MSGLVLKDLFCLKKVLRNYLVIIAVYFVISLANPAMLTGLVTVMTVLLCMLSLNCFAFDQACKWDSYGGALPVTRNQTVLARYCTTLVLTAFTAVCYCLLALGMYLAGNYETALGILLSGALCTIAGLLINAINVPLVYQFGPERGRLIFVGLVAILAAVVAAGIMLLTRDSPEADIFVWLVNALEHANFVLAAVVLVLGCIAALLISYGISCAIFRKKDL